MSNTDVKVFWCLVALFAIQILWFYPKLPQTMSIHFDLMGRADGWADKQGFIWLYIGITALVMAPLIGMRYWAHKIPFRLINIPKKEYWLNEENRERTLHMVSSRILWFGNATLILFICLFHLTYLANTGPENRLPPFWFGMVIVGYIVVSIVWSIYFVSPFRKGGSK